MEIIGSQILSQILHGLSQSLIIPVIIILLIFVIFALISLGSFISEYRSRKNLKLSKTEEILNELNELKSYDEIKNKIENLDIDEKYKIALRRIINNHSLNNESMKAFGTKVIEEEELKMEKSVEKTDIIVRLGPTMGLMGTLIPMGPGLAALGAGNIELLAQAIIIAFDTTVTGLAAASLAYVISKLRKRWYEEDLSNFEVLIISLIEILKNNP